MIKIWKNVIKDLGILMGMGTHCNSKKIELLKSLSPFVLKTSTFIDAGYFP